MDPTDSGIKLPPRYPFSPAWQVWALVAAILVLFVGSVVSLRIGPATRTDDATRLYLDSMMQARQVYLFRHKFTSELKSIASQQATLIANMKRLEQMTHSPRTIRRLALTEYMVGDPDWKSSLLLLRTALRTGPAFDVERELSMWRLALEEHPDMVEVPVLRNQIADLDLGWYKHIALEAMYRQAGMQEEALAESQDAMRSTSFFTAMVIAAFLLGLTGIGLGIGLFLYLRWRQDNPNVLLRAPWQRILETTPIPPLSREKANALYSIFLCYMISFAVVRFAISWTIRALVGGSLSRLGPTLGALISIGVMCLPLLPPYILYRRLKQRVGIRAADIGFRTRGIGGDILWGVAGYAIALPLIWYANIISLRLFHTLNTPLNPAITEFTSSHSVIYQLTVLTQAAVIAPLAEETLFRGVFFAALTPRMGAVLASLLTSAIFALLHPQLPLGFLGLFTLGLVFNTLYRLRGSLLPNILAHAINNAVIFILLSVVVGD
jgi:membrane protease YdiL (CAAX protease family)